MSENTNKHVKLHVLKTTGKTQDISVMQVPNPHFDSTNTNTGSDEYINILIDCGSYKSAEGHLRILKRTLSIEKIHYLYITHFHGDHIGSLKTLFNGYSNNQYSDTGLSLASDFKIILPSTPLEDVYNSLNVIDKESGLCFLSELEAFKNGKVTIVPSDNAHTFDIGELQLDFRNYNLSSYYEDAPEDYIFDYNDTSLCCIMTYGKTRIGFFGDIGLKAQENLAGEIGHLDLMNVEHHGRNGGHYRPFYDSIAPKMCFTQDGKGLDGTDHILSTMSKTQEYLQENGIPNYPVSANKKTMTFNIYEHGISTTANAAKYAVNFKGATSIFGAVQDNVPGSNGNISLYNLLKNMEHGTFLSCAIKNNSIQLGQLFETLGITEAEYAEFIVYKNGSIYNNAQLTIDNELDSGYIILIPHSKYPSCCPVTAYWSLNLSKDKNPSADINIVFKPIRDSEHFKFFKDFPKDSDFEEASGFKNGFLSCENLVITPSESCMVNYSILLRNQSPTTSKTITFNDGSSTKTFIIPSNGNVTVSNVVNLNVTKKDSAITEADTISITGDKTNLQDLYVRISGYVTTRAKTVAKTLTAQENDITLPTHSGYPMF